MANISPQLMDLVRTLEQIKRATGEVGSEFSDVQEIIASFAVGVSTLNELREGILRFDQAIQNLGRDTSVGTELNSALAEMFGLLKQSEQEVDKLSGKLSVLGGAGAGLGSRLPLSGEAPSQQYVNTFGNTSLKSTGINMDTVQIQKAIETGLQSIEALYSDIGKAADSYKVSIDAANGDLIIEQDILKQINDQYQQIIHAKFRINPNNPADQGTTYTKPMSAFAESMGGADKAEQFLSKYNLDLTRVVAVQKELTSDITRFSVVAENGYEQGTIWVDKYGKATMQASRNQTTLFSNIERNISKVIEWAIATGAVYTVLSQFRNAAQNLDDIQEAFADLSIATGVATDKMQAYYDAATQVASVTGTDVVQVLQLQQKALRATASETDRVGMANKLLSDSMTLSRLSGMTQADSLDTLLGALRQTNMGLDQGATLLDKWVRVSQHAGVGISDMAESFAITAAAADTVGVSMDQLNGLVAVLSENTTLSATEIGNALRTMMSNITSPEAVKQLEQFGIAVKDVNGNMRSWMEITQDIVQLMNAGLLNNEQINQLANAIGGGSRRGPQLIAIWRNYAQVNDIAQQSANANGEAANAMAVKIDTLRTAVTELNNAFNDLVEGLGFEGGFVGMLTDGIRLVTQLIEGFKTLTDTLGGSAAKIALMVTAMAALSKYGGAIMGGIGGLGSSALGQYYSGGILPTGGGALSTSIGGALQPRIGAPLTAGVQGALAGPGAGVALGEAFSGHLDRAGVALAGAFVGNMILPGAGGLIGSVVADAFVTQVQNKAQAFHDLGLGLTGQTSSQLEQTIINTLQTAMPSAQLPRGVSSFEAAQTIASAYKGGNLTAGLGLPNMAAGLLGPLQYGQVFSNFQNQGYSRNEAEVLSKAAARLSAQNIQDISDAVDAYNAAKAREVQSLSQASDQFTPATALQASQYRNGSFGIAAQRQITGQTQQAFSQALVSGQYDQYQHLVDAQTLALSLTPQLATALGDTNLQLTDYLNLTDLITNATEEQKGNLVPLISEINNLKDEIEQLNNVNTEGVDAFASGPLGNDIAAKTAQVAALQDQLKQMVQVYQHAQQIQQTRENYQSFTSLPEGATLPMIQQAEQQAKAAQAQYAQFLGLDPQLLAESVTDPLILAYGDAYYKIEGLTSDFAKFFTDTVQKSVDDANQSLQFTFKDIRNISKQEFYSPAVQGKLQSYTNLLNQFRPYGYNEQNQNVGLMFQGNQLGFLNTNMTALNLTLQDLVDVEKKQLEGFWNLPNGMSAFVPITSLFYAQQNNSNAMMNNQTPTNYNPTVVVNTGPTTVNTTVDGQVIARTVVDQVSREFRNVAKGGGGGWTRPLAI